MRHTLTTAAFFLALALCVAGLVLNMRWLAFAGMALSAAAWWARQGGKA